MRPPRFAIRGLPAAALLATSALLAACTTPADKAAPNGAAPNGTSPAVAATEGYLPVPGGRVWYRRMGGGPGIPLLAVHGGPGGTSCRFAALAPLADERPVIYYDQLGSGRSDHPSDTTLWTVARFVDELEAVRRGLGLDSLVLLGHSWGGALVAEYLLTAPRPAVRAVVLSSPLLSTPRWIADANALRAAMPVPLRDALDRHERAGTTEFRSTGSRRTWDRAADLATLAIPALLVAGEFDEARPATLAEFAATMPNARVVTIPGAAHGTYREKPAEYQGAVRQFLRTVQAPTAPR
jgi:proline iminopeptidase